MKEAKPNSYHIVWYSEDEFFGGYDSMYIEADTLLKAVIKAEDTLTNRYSHHEILKASKVEKTSLYYEDKVYESRCKKETGA